jgi:hypothetical protein
VSAGWRYVHRASDDHRQVIDMSVSKDTVARDWFFTTAIAATTANNLR